MIIDRVRGHKDCLRILEVLNEEPPQSDKFIIIAEILKDAPVENFFSLITTYYEESGYTVKLPHPVRRLTGELVAEFSVTRKRKVLRIILFRHDEFLSIGLVPS